MRKLFGVKLVFSFMLACGMFLNPLFAQDEFHNLPVKVGKFQPVDIKFGDEIVNAILPCKGTFELERSSNGKSYTIINQKEEQGADCILTLLVGEGKKQKKHSFSIIYQETIPEEEMVYDFTDSKKIKDAIKKQQEAAKNSNVKPAKPATSTAATTATNTKSPEAAPPKPAVQEPKPEPPAPVQVNNEQVRKDNYYKTIGNAEMAFNAGEYDKAETFYKEAKQYEDPGGTYVKSRLAEIDKRKKEQENLAKKQKADTERENNYNASIAAGDAAIENNDLENAELQYRKALTYKTQDSYANSKLIEIDAIRAKRIKDQEKADITAKYQAARKSGDEYFNKGDYETARAAYTDALSYLPGDAYATNQLKNIQTSIARSQEAAIQKEKQQHYDENILMADAAFKTGDYETAIEKYNTASKWKPSERYPGNKLSEIKKLQKESAMKAEQERIALEKQKKLDADFAAQIKKADDLMNKGDLNGASTQYKKASELKPYEDYPKKKISEIQGMQEAIALAAKLRKDSIDAANAKKVKYNDALARGKKSLAAQDYPSAKAAYMEASLLFENESYPKEQIAVVDKKLADIAAREKARQDSLDRVIAFNRAYDSTLVVGANAMLTENYDESIAAFRKATELKPEDVYAKNLLRYVTDRKKDKENRLAATSVMDRRAAFRAKYEMVEPAMKDQRYLDAQALIVQAKTLMDPGEDYGRANEYFANRLSTISYQLSLAEKNGTPIKPLTPGIGENVSPAKTVFTPVNTSSAEIKEPVVATKRPDIEIISKNTIRSTPDKPVARTDALPVQQSAIPYSREELWKRYPGMNFMEPPPGQAFNVAEFYDTTENARLSNLVRQETDNRVNISDTQNSITLTCEGISFSGTNAFYRLRLQNKSNTAFAAGVMSLVWQMKDMNEYKLYPGYVSSFPLLLPQKEIIIVFVAKSAYLHDEDKLNFSLRDRGKTIRLNLQIPGAVYNAESNR